jgi:hypothetical protein
MCRPVARGFFQRLDGQSAGFGELFGSLIKHRRASREEAQRFDGIITCWLNHTRAIAAAISALREKP